MNSIHTQRLILIGYKRWADFWSSVSIVLSIALFLVIGYLMDITGASAADRIGALILLATIIITVCLWQGLAFGLARLETAIRSSR